MKSNLQNFIKSSGVTVVRDVHMRPSSTPSKTPSPMTNSRSLSLSPMRQQSHLRAKSMSPPRVIRGSCVVSQPSPFKTPQKTSTAPMSPLRPKPVTGKLMMTPFEYKLVNMSSKPAVADTTVNLRSALVKKPKLSFEPIVHGNRNYRVRMVTVFAMRGVKVLAKHDAGIDKIAGNASEADITNVRFRVELVDDKSKSRVHAVDVYAYKTGTVRITAAVPKDDVNVLVKVRDWVVFNYLPGRRVFLGRVELKSVNAQWKHNGTFTPSTALRYLHQSKKNDLSYEPEMKQYFIQFKIREHTVQLYAGGTVTLTGAKSLEAVKRGYAAVNMVLYQMFLDGIIRTSNAPFASPKRPVKKAVVNAPKISWVGSTLYVGSKKCSSKLIKKGELVAVAKSLGVMHEKLKKDALCAAIQRAFPKNGSSPSRNTRVPSRPDLTEKGIRNDLVQMFGKTWMTTYGKFARKDLVSDVKNLQKAISFLKDDQLNVYGQPKKTITDGLKRGLVNMWKDLRRDRYTREVLYDSMLKYVV